MKMWNSNKKNECALGEPDLYQKGDINDDYCFQCLAPNL